MRLREVYLSDREMLGITATRIWNLDLNDPIAYIKIQVLARSARTGGKCDLYITQGVSKIEVVDGSDVLYSCDMCEAGAAQLYGMNGMPYTSLVGGGGGRSVQMVELRFGRDNSDQEYMLDPKKFVNPQLKITYNYPVNAANWTVSEQFISVSCMVAENATVDPRGFFMTKRIYSWLTQIGAWETIDMPRDYPYRVLMMNVHHPNYQMYNYLTEAKMSCDIDKFVNFHVKMDDLGRQNNAMYGMNACYSVGHGDGANVVRIPYCWSHIRGITLGTPPVANDCHIAGQIGLYADVVRAAGAVPLATHEAEALAIGDEYISLWKP